MELILISKLILTNLSLMSFFGPLLAPFCHSWHILVTTFFCIYVYQVYFLFYFWHLGHFTGPFNCSTDLRKKIILIVDNFLFTLQSFWGFSFLNFHIFLCLSSPLFFFYLPRFFALPQLTCHFTSENIRFVLLFGPFLSKWFILHHSCPSKRN